MRFMVEFWVQCEAGQRSAQGLNEYQVGFIVLCLGCIYSSWSSGELLFDAVDFHRPLNRDSSDGFNEQKDIWICMWEFVFKPAIVALKCVIRPVANS